MLSLCMITKNEEQFIEQCLFSVKGLVDELIIADTGSTDKTIELAKKHGATVFSVPWTNDFSAARNAALSHAHGDWILVLDADETLNRAEHALISECLKDTAAWGYRVPIFNYSQDSTVPGWSTVRDTFLACGFPGFILTRVVRLFRNKPEIRYRFSVHEGVEFALEDHHLLTRTASFVIHHYGAVRGTSSSAFKQQNYFEMVQKDGEQYPTHPKPFYELGIGYLDKGDLDNAQAAFDRAVKNNERYLIPYHYLGEIAFRRGNLPEARTLLEKSITLHPESEETYFRLGQIALKSRDTDAAIGYWNKALERNPRSIRYFDALVQVSIAQRALLPALALLYDAAANTNHPHFVAEKKRIEEELIAQAKSTLSHGPNRIALVTLTTIALYRREKKKVTALCAEAKKYFSGADARVFDALLERAEKL